VEGRRVLVPAKAGGSSEGAIPAMGSAAQEVPCPPDIRASSDDVRRLRAEPIGDLAQIARVELCELKHLITALKSASICSFVKPGQL
jgi:hypothetical protein